MAPPPHRLDAARREPAEPDAAPARPSWRDAAALTGAAMRETVRADLPGERRGVALLVVLVTLAVMAALSTEFAYNTRTNIWMAGNITSETQAYYHARSATKIASLAVNARQNFPQMNALLSMAGKRAQNIEIWRQACKFVEIYATGKATIFGFDILDLSEEEAIGVSRGEFKCEVEAEDGRVNLNAAAADEAAQVAEAVAGGLQGRGAAARNRGLPNRRGGRQFNQQNSRQKLGLQLVGLFRPLINQGALDSEEEMFELAINIMDWTDADDSGTDIDETGQFIDGAGPETANYGQYDYVAKNAKMDTVGELQLVEGMSTDIYCKVRDRVTVFATEKMNVSDANMQTVKGLLCSSIQDILAQAELCWTPMLTFQGPMPFSPMDQALQVLDQCRRARKALYSRPIRTVQDFQQFFTKWPQLSGLLTGLQGAAFPIDWGLLRQTIGVNTKMVRIEASGEYRGTKRELVTIIDSSTGSTVYSGLD